MSYESCLQSMLAAKLQWCRRHANLEARISFNFPPDVCLIAPIKDAMRRKLVTANTAGELLLADIIEAADEEPTVLMVRAVLEIG